MKSILAIAVFLGVANAAVLEHKISSIRKDVKRAANGDQNPKIWDALDALRGKKPLTIPEIQDLYANAVAGKDFPINSQIPAAPSDLSKEPGFYADDSTQCQGFHRVDSNGEVTSYLCPNQSLFNQITLICDWWYNIDCSKSKQFVDYSNSRLREEGLVFLDDQMDYQAVAEATGAVEAAAAAAPAKSSGKKKGKKSKSAAQ